MSLWSTAGFPHRGWRLVGSDDLGPDSRDWSPCTVCGTPLRYTHAIEHDSYDPQSVGIVCCANLTIDREIKNEITREDKRMRSLATKRARWLERSWIATPKGERLGRKVEGWRMVVFRRPTGRWSWVASRGSEKHWSPRDYPSIVAAKMALFDAAHAV